MSVQTSLPFRLHPDGVLAQGSVRQLIIGILTKLFLLCQCVLDTGLGEAVTVLVFPVARVIQAALYPILTSWTNALRSGEVAA